MASPSSIIHLVSSVTGGQVYAVAVQVSMISYRILLYLMAKLINRPYRSAIKLRTGSMFTTLLLNGKFTKWGEGLIAINVS
jgi:hypothetical protein